MNHLNIFEILKQRPSVHKLCYGGFIQEALQLKENVYAIPLKALGFVSEAGYASQYVVEICGGNVEQKQFDSLLKQSENALPVIALVVVLDGECSPENMEADAEKQLLIPEKIAS